MKDLSTSRETIWGFPAFILEPIDKPMRLRLVSLFWIGLLLASSVARADLFNISDAFSSMTVNQSKLDLQLLGDVSKFQNLPGSWVHGSFFNVFGSRDYYFYMPANHPAGPIPLVVLLHGCEQDAPTLAAGTGMNELAEENGFAVLYPNQASIYNEYNCWNWFLPINQFRNSGELSIVMGMVWEVGQQISVDESHVFIGGLSAGGAMASNLIACYSDIFTGAAIFSGLEFQAAFTAEEALQVAKTGSTQDVNQSGIRAAESTPGGAGKVQAILVIHGSADSAVNPINSTRIVEQMTKMNDILDDALDNNSQNLGLIDSQTDQVPNGYAYQSDFYGGGGKIHILNVVVEGMDHAWSGAKTTGKFLDPKGPNAGQLLWRFLSQYAGT